MPFKFLYISRNYYEGPIFLESYFDYIFKFTNPALKEILKERYNEVRRIKYIPVYSQFTSGYFR